MDQLHDMNGYPMAAPNMMHSQPPRIFGNYAHMMGGHDGLGGGIDMSAHMFGDPGSLMEDTSEAKRRRIARACDMCRKKKIKCDGKLPACTHCINYKTECVFTQVEKKRNPPKGAKYIEGLENRLARMENLLRLSGLLSEDDNGATDLATLEKRFADRDMSRRASMIGSTSDPTSPSVDDDTTPHADQSSPVSALTSPEPQASEKNGEKGSKHKDSKDADKSSEEVEDLSDMMCSLVTNNCGETRYIGSSSGFSIFSPKGIQWVNDKTGDASFQEMITTASVDDNKWQYWKPEVFSDLFERRVFQPLPPKAECVSLLKDFFKNFNCMFPLFHQPTFMHLVERHYSRDPYEGSGWWASLNVALAISHRLRVMSNLVPQEEDQKAWGYLKNAMAVATELTMRNTDLLSVQALLGMALFMQGTPNPQPSFFLVAAAIRLSHSIGLHKRGSGFNLNPVEIEQRKRVFWIGYMLDKDTCIRSGRPPAQDDDDMNVDLPSADPADNIGNIPLADGKGKLNLFRLMCEFATIQSKVYKRLYSVMALKQSDGELLNTIGELDSLLEEWKDSIPVDFRPEHEIKASHTPLILHIVVLHFAYYNCLTTIHRMSVHHGYWTSRLSNYAIQGLNTRPLNPRVFSSAALCVSAARASIHLVKYIPQGDNSCAWLVLYFPVSALMTLFGNILQNPQDPSAHSDVRLMNLVVGFLSMLGSEAENGSIKRMLGVCSEFERIAKVVLDKSERESSSRRKRKSHDEARGQQGTNGVAPRGMSSHTAAVPSQQAGRYPVNGNGIVGGAGVAGLPSQFTSPNLNGNGAMNQSSPPGMNIYSNQPTPMTDLSQNATNNGNYTENLDSMTPYAGMTPYGDMQQSYSQQAGNQQPNGSGAGMGLNSGGGVMAGSMSPPSIPGGNSFIQQPFVPQDLWQMPMTLDWDWADMTGGPYPSFENADFGDEFGGVNGGGGGGGGIDLRGF